MDVMNLNKAARIPITSPVVLSLIIFSSLLLAKAWPPVNIDGLPSSLPETRAQELQAKIPSYPISRVNDTAWVAWHNNHPAHGYIISHKGDYRKISDFSSIQWVENAFISTTHPAHCDMSPLMIDLGRDGFNLGKKGETVIFDLMASGKPVVMQWVKAGENDAFLAMDLNGNGVVDDGSELFGEGIRLKKTNLRASNGYSALAQYDNRALGGNRDGIIDRRDKIWDKLFLWVDKNADGVAHSEENYSLSTYMIKSISLNYRITNRKDFAGNSLPYWSWVKTDRRKGPRRMKMVDVFFVAYE